MLPLVGFYKPTVVFFFKEFFIIFVTNRLIIIFIHYFLAAQAVFLPDGFVVFIQVALC